MHAQYFLLLCLVSCALAQNSCTTPNGETAKCVSIFACPILYEAGKSKNSASHQFVQDSICKKTLKSIFVCCGSDATHKIKAQEITEQNCSYVNDDFRKYWQNGTDTFPWMAFLEYENLVTGERSFRCKGSIISKRHVLAPTHCVAGGFIKNYKLVNIRLGQSNEVCNDAGMNVGFERVTPFAVYNDDPKYNDVSLIKLNTTIIYSKFVNAMCLPMEERLRANVKLVVPGWGLTEDGMKSEVKMKVQVPVVDNKDCGKKFEKLFKVRNSQICAGGEKGKDSCKGDSGGPLMYRDVENDQWSMEGIVSLGLGCGAEGWPAIYTNVRSYIGWIKDNAI